MATNDNEFFVIAKAITSRGYSISHVTDISIARYLDIDLDLYFNTANNKMWELIKMKFSPFKIKNRHRYIVTANNEDNIIFDENGVKQYIDLFDFHIVLYLKTTMKEYIHNAAKYNGMEITAVMTYCYFKKEEDCKRFIEDYLEPMAVMRELSQ